MVFCCCKDNCIIIIQAGQYPFGLCAMLFPVWIRTCLYCCMVGHEDHMSVVQHVPVWWVPGVQLYGSNGPTSSNIGLKGEGGGGG